jgi:hypothetical protein
VVSRRCVESAIGWAVSDMTTLEGRPGAAPLSRPAAAPRRAANEERRYPTS